MLNAIINAKIIRHSEPNLYNGKTYYSLQIDDGFSVDTISCSDTVYNGVADGKSYKLCFACDTRSARRPYITNFGQ